MAVVRGRVSLQAEVTRENIFHGVQDSITECPLALAIGDTPAEGFKVLVAEVGAEETRVWIQRDGEEEYLAYRNSPRVQDWLAEFDEADNYGDSSKPFTLVLDWENRTAKDSLE